MHFFYFFGEIPLSGGRLYFKTFEITVAIATAAAHMPPIVAVCLANSARTRSILVSNPEILLSTLPSRPAKSARNAEKSSRKVEKSLQSVSNLRLQRFQNDTIHLRPVITICDHNVLLL